MEVKHKSRDVRQRLADSVLHGERLEQWQREYIATALTGKYPVSAPMAAHDEGEG